MKTSQQKIFFVVLIINLLLSGCGAGQIFGSTVTPSPTITSTVTLTPTPTQTLTPTVTPTPTLEPVQWDVSPSYIETINIVVMDTLPIQISLETDVTRGGFKYGIRDGWTNNNGQSANESLAEMWTRGIFEAWWYNSKHETEPTDEDFKVYIKNWSECLSLDVTGNNECWQNIQLEVVANDLHTFEYDPKKVRINPPNAGRIIFTGDSQKIRNVTRSIGTCESSYGTNYLGGELLLYIGKPEGCKCRSRVASMASHMAIALMRLQNQLAFSKRDISVSESLYIYISNYTLNYAGDIYDRRYILREKFRDVSC